jgi:circadian clock protein KaiB
MTPDEATPVPQNSLTAFEKALATSEARHYVLRLYVSGTTPNSLRAIENIRRICDEHREAHFDLEIIDIYQQPQLARNAQIVAAPTLVRELPLPLRKLLGDLSKTERILAGLDLVVKE